MSKYMEMKAQIELMQKQLEAVRAEEVEEQCTDIKKKIVAFDIKPEMLFSQEALKEYGASLRRARRPTGSVVPPKYRWNGNTWGGKGGIPKWFTEARAIGITPEQMLIANQDKEGKK